MTLQQQFVDLYHKSGLTYAQIAQLSGVSTSTISRILKGDSAGTADSLERLISTLRDLPAVAAPSPTAETSCNRCYQAMTERIDDLQAQLAAAQNDYELRTQKIKELYERTIDSMRQTHARELEQIEQSHLREIEQRNKAEEKADRTSRRQTIALWLLVACILFVVLWDITHGGIGYVRYSAWNTQNSIINEIICMMI